MRVSEMKPFSQVASELIKALNAYKEMQTAKLIGDLEPMSKPFDLALARQGHPLVTRDGRKVLRFEYRELKDFPIAVVAERDDQWTIRYANGSYFMQGDCRYDLLLADLPEVEETWYVNLLAACQGRCCVGYLYASPESAKNCAIPPESFDEIAKPVTIRRPGTWTPKEPA